MRRLIFFMEYDGIVHTKNGEGVFTYAHIEKLREYGNPLNIIAQKGCQEKFLASPADITIFGGNRCGGKALIFNELVCTPFGFRKIQDIKAGDIITGLDGGMQRVVYNSYQGFKECVRLKFVDGSYADCCIDHLWNIKQSNHCSKKRALYNLPLEDEWRVWTTQMIIDHMEKQKGKKQPRHLSVPLCKPVRFTKGKYFKPKFSPYLIGALIGDGCIADSVISKNCCYLFNPDEEVIGEFKKSVGYSSCEFEKGCYRMRINDKELIAEIQKLNITGRAADKHVPDMYLYGTLEERWALVQGLMDTDGTIDERGHLSYTTISKQLAEDVKFLINSLGGLATIGRGTAGYRNSNGEFIQCNDAYTLYIRIPDAERMFRVKRKKERCKPYNGGISINARRIIGYEMIGKKECCCIAVTNPDSLFLTRDFIVTHNSWALLMEVLKDINNPNFASVILRNEKEDLSNIVNKSYELFSQYGKYNRSISDMTWNFYNGGFLKFSYYADSYEDFVKRFQGKEFAFIGIDEITHSDYLKFKYLITNNRNAYGIRNRFYGTCNPDPDSWVRKFIDWWIDENGNPIPERDGVIRYCFMDGDRPEDIYWGDSVDEVYNQCRHIIDPLLTPGLISKGYDKSAFVKTVTFIKGKLEENVALISSDPNYLANLAQQDEESRARDLEGNWNFKAAGDDIIKMEHMERFFKNTAQYGDEKRRVSCDIAYEGGDNLVLWLWIGNHIEDVYVSRDNSKRTEECVAYKLREWGVLEKDFVFDLNGPGQDFKGKFPDAVRFNNMAAPIPATKADEKSIKYVYSSLKSQCADILVKKIKNEEISINPDLLSRKFSGNGYSGVTLYNILMKERKAIRDAETDKGFALIKKETMKKYVGHSPDFIEAMIYRQIFDIKKHNTKPKGLWRL